MLPISGKPEIGGPPSSFETRRHRAWEIRVGARKGDAPQDEGGTMS
jgi:hypothetical protein